MPSSTSRLAIPYPTSTDPVNVHTDMQSMADRLDNIATPKYVTSLPGSPADGDEIFYMADSTNGVIWHFRYRAASASTYKWEYVGGPSLHATITASDEATTSTSYTALGTAGPNITVPLAGEYDVQLRCNAFGSAASVGVYMSFSTGATAASDADAAMVQVAAGGTDVHGLHRVVRKTVTAAATVLSAKYRVSSGTGTYRGPSSVPANAPREMRVTPIRVG